MQLNMGLLHLFIALLICYVDQTGARPRVSDEQLNEVQTDSVQQQFMVYTDGGTSMYMPAHQPLTDVVQQHHLTSSDGEEFTDGLTNGFVDSSVTRETTKRFFRQEDIGDY